MHNVIKQTSSFYSFIKNTRPIIILSKILCGFIILICFSNIIGINLELDHATLDRGILHRLYGFIDISGDGRLVNYFLSGLFFSSSILIFVVYLLEKSGIYLFLSLLNTFIWGAVSFNYHQKLAENIKPFFEINAFLDGEFEIFAWLIAFFLFLPFFIKCIRNLKIEDFGVVTWLFTSFILLCIFAIVIDYISEILFVYFGFKSHVLTFMEEVGELLAGSLTFIISLSALLIKFGQYNQPSQ